MKDIPNYLKEHCIDIYFNDNGKCTYFASFSSKGHIYDKFDPSLSFHDISISNRLLSILRLTLIKFIKNEKKKLF